MNTKETKPNNRLDKTTTDQYKHTRHHSHVEILCVVCSAFRPACILNGTHTHKKNHIYIK